jgi:NADH-quinone oxidoreductase subunit L
MSNLVWLIPVFPLIGFLIIGLLGKNLSKGLVGIIGCGSILLSLILSAAIFFEIKDSHQAITIKLFDWIHTGAFTADFAFLIDQLSVLFLLIITGVGFLIHVYSVGYMHNDPAFSRFFSYLNLFVFFMLLLPQTKHSL